MRELGSRVFGDVFSVAAALATVALFEQLRDPTSTLRLRAAELADRLREVTP